jgi:hypothetical protein
MKVSEVTIDDLVNFIRLDEPSEIETSELERMKDSAVAQIKAYTGLDDEGLDKHVDLTQALFVIVADMFDNRNYQLEKAGGVNRMVMTILNSHSVNLL